MWSQQYLEENIASLDVHLDEQDLQQIEKIIPRDIIHGDRYTEDMTKLTNQWKNLYYEVAEDVANSRKN